MEEETRTEHEKEKEKGTEKGEKENQKKYPLRQSFFWLSLSSLSQRKKEGLTPLLLHLLSSSGASSYSSLPPLPPLELPPNYKH